MPTNTEFIPAGRIGNKEEAVVMTMDEYEAVRLIDHEGLMQEECAECMQVSRTTVQEIYDSARKKISYLLADGKPLIIKGGKYRLCEGGEPRCRRGRCWRRSGRGE